MACLDAHLYEIEYIIIREFFTIDTLTLTPRTSLDYSDFCLHCDSDCHFHLISLWLFIHQRPKAKVLYVG
jgi:hypothetical protein